jgi:hypothetical protein
LLTPCASCSYIFRAASSFLTASFFFRSLSFSCSKPPDGNAARARREAANQRRNATKSQKDGECHADAIGLAVPGIVYPEIDARRWRAASRRFLAAVKPGS